jgi:hypothetical protein
MVKSIDTVAQIALEDAFLILLLRFQPTRVEVPNLIDLKML